MNNIKIKKALVDALINEFFDQEYTPHVVVDTTSDTYVGPTHLANKEGFPVFSLGLNAVRNYDVTDEGISFEATFSGKNYWCDLRYETIAGVFPKEEPGVFFPFGVTVEPKVEPKVEPEPVAYLDKIAAEKAPWRNPKANADWAKSAKVITCGKQHS